MYMSFDKWAWYLIPAAVDSLKATCQQMDEVI